VLGQTEILEALRDHGITSADIGRALELPSSRIAEMYAGKRLLKLSEAVKLVAEFELETRSAKPNADVLVVLLNAILPKSQRGTRAADLSIRALAEALEYGLGLVASSPAIPGNPDALALAAQATADRLVPPGRGASFSS
jgi:hypothetical protein